MHGLEDYVFVDQNYMVLGKMGLHDDEVAEAEAQRLAKAHGKTVTCLREVVIVTPQLSEKEWRDAVCKILQQKGIDAKLARELADGGEYMPDETPEDTADTELYYMAQDSR